MSTASPRLGHYALGGIVACILLNLPVRTLLRIGGPFATLLVAGLVALGLALVFRWRCGRRPYPVERRILVGWYALGLGLLYLGLLVLIELQDAHGPAALLLFAAHYLTYPLLAWFALAPERDGE